MARAVEESDGMDAYDYLLINDDLEQSANRLHKIITNVKMHQESGNEAFRMNRHTAFADTMRNELKCFSKGE
jgi:guanylate kinase